MSDGIPISMVPARRPHAWYVSEAKRLVADGVERKAVRFALLSSCTLDPLLPYLVLGMAGDGCRLVPHVGAFNQVFQEILDEGSALYRFGPDIVAIAIRLEELAPEMMAPGADLRQIGDRVLDELIRLVETFRDHSSAAILVNNFAPPEASPWGLGDAGLEESVQAAIARLNAGLAARLREVPAAHVLDYHGLVAACGRRRWQDDRMWYMGRIPVAYEHLDALSRRYLAAMRQVLGRGRKVLVLDLDNTLWGGTLGEEGIAGVKLGEGYPGNVFCDFQREIRALHERGVVLAVCSKNDRDLVDRMFAEHPHMILQADHIAAWRVNWQNKADNLQELSAELNLGLDSFVFFDDHPMERELVRSALPMVATLEVPASPLGYRHTLWECGYFDALHFSQEDRRRGRLYQANRLREDFQRAAGSLPEFLQGLDMVATVEEVGSLTIGRAIQLIQKTNQFNLTARRYTEAEIRTRLAGGDRLFLLSLDDRFGDNGWVGLALIDAQAAGTWRFDLLLLSCRVLGRGVEKAFVTHLARLAREADVWRLVGEHLPTERNSQTAGFYPALGFKALEDGPEGSRWEFDLREGALPEISWVRMVARGHERAGN